MTRRTPMIAAVLAIILPFASAASAESKSPLLDIWYTSLFDVNRIALAHLLTEDAEIRLEDLGVTQTKQEFLDSLDEWEEAIAGADFAWQIEDGTPVDARQATALVCYQSEDNQVMTRESFTFAGGKISRSVQMQAGEDCDEF